MESPKSNAIVPHQSDKLSKVESSPKSLREVLENIDAGMPEELEIWDDESRGGKRIKKEKEFNPNIVEENITRTISAIAKDQIDQEKLTQQFASIYSDAFEKLSVPPEGDPEAWRYDRVPAGLVDRFYVHFPQELQQAVEGKPNRREITQNVLDIVTTALERVRPMEEKGDDWEARDFNSWLPHDVSEVCRAAERFSYYVKGGTEDDAVEKLRFISAVKLAQEKSEVTNTRDIGLYSTRASFIASTQDILIEYPGSLPVLNDYVLHLAEKEPRLFVDIEKKSFIGIASAARDIAELTGVHPKDVIAEAEKQTFEIAKKDLVASIMFVKYAFPALAKATRIRGYSSEQAQQFLTLTSDYFCKANNNRELVEGRFINERMQGFVEDGLIDYLLEIPVEGFAQEVINDSCHPGDNDEATKQIDKVRNAVNMLIASQTISDMADTPLEPQEVVDFYHEIMKVDKLPRGIISMRQNLVDHHLENIHPANDGREHFLALFNQMPDYDYPRQKVVDLGLEEISKNKYLASVTFETGFQKDLQTFAYYVEGLGILDNAMEYRLRGKGFADYLPQPDTPEGKSALFASIANLAKIYRQANTEAQRDRLDELFVYALENEQLRVPFFVHLYQVGNFETMQSLSWVTRLAETDKDNMDADQVSDGLKSKVDRFLSEMLLDSRFTLPQGKEELKPELPDLIVENTDNVALAKRVDTTMPLGRAISIIAAADKSPETAIQIADALGKVHLHSIEDAKTLSGPIIASFVKHLNLDPALLKEHMFTFRSGEEMIDEISEKSPVAGIIADISAVMGTGTMPSLAYNTIRNDIIVTENFPGGYEVDGLGEEIMHWVRNTVIGGEHGNPVVQEFWGFVGRRIARSALGTSDTNVKAEDFEKHILGSVEQILDVERFGSLNIGYQGQLRNAFIHAIGYAAGSNVDINNLPKDLIDEPDEYILENFVKTCGPGQEWFKGLIEKVKVFYQEYTKEGDVKVTTIADVLEPIVEVLDILPYVNQKELGL